MKTPLLEMKNLQKRYPVYGPLGKLFPPRTYMRAVSNMCLALYEGGPMAWWGNPAAERALRDGPSWVW